MKKQKKDLVVYKHKKLKKYLSIEYCGEDGEWTIHLLDEIDKDCIFDKTEILIDKVLEYALDIYNGSKSITISIEDIEEIPIAITPR